MLKERPDAIRSAEAFFLILAIHGVVVNLNFFKYHGTGNDFILLDGRAGKTVSDPDTIARLCDRHFGIGADGLIVLDHVPDYDFRMTYYNSDGRISTMCGNGGRCIVAFADFLSPIQDEVLFLASDGPHSGRILSREGNRYVIRLKMKDVGETTRWHNNLLIDTGSPHLIRFMDDINIPDIKSLARPLRYHEDFEPQGINVNFVQEIPSGISIRSYERGVEDETLSCGTGVTAAALAYAHRHQLDSGPLTVHTSGGDLLVHFKRINGGKYIDIWLEGPAVKVFEGVIKIS